MPKALPEAAETFRQTDQQIRKFLVELGGIQKVSAASNQDFVLSIQLETFLEQLETGEQALVAYARKKRVACAPFYLLSLSEILATLSRDIAPQDSTIRFDCMRATVSYVNIYHKGPTAHAVSWVRNPNQNGISVRHSMIIVRPTDKCGLPRCLAMGPKQSTSRYP